jgi:hypothetical protein
MKNRHPGGFHCLTQPVDHTVIGFGVSGSIL